MAADLELARRLQPLADGLPTGLLFPLAPHIPLPGALAQRGCAPAQ